MLTFCPFFEKNRDLPSSISIGQFLLLISDLFRLLISIDMAISSFSKYTAAAKKAPKDSKVNGSTTKGQQS